MINHTKQNAKLNIGVAGDIGSFSEEAALQYAKTKLKSDESHDITLHYLIDMEGVLAAVSDGAVDIGIFPVVNSRGGLVRMAFDAMGKYQFKVIDELGFEVHQCLLAKPATEIQHIKTIVSHAQAFAQCKAYLHQNFNHAQLIEWQDTAKAAKDLSQDNIASLHCAVIAPKRAATIYGLKIIAEDIQDEHPNITTFIIVRNVGFQI